MDYYSKYLKYKNKYLTLKKMLGGETNKLVLCFDFDLTLTNVHTGGHPVYGTEYFVNIGLLIDLLEKLSSKYPLYIVTRGMEDKVKAYLQSRNMMKYFKNVFGATESLPIARDDWHKIKVDYLNTILDLENVDKNNLYFYDDTSINISEALKNNYINSYVVKSPGADLLNHLNFIFSYNTINDMDVGEYKLINKYNSSKIISRDSLVGSTRDKMQKGYLLEKEGKSYYIMKHDLLGIKKDGNILKNGAIWDPSKPMNIGDIFKINSIDLNLIKSYFDSVDISAYLI